MRAAHLLPLIALLSLSACGPSVVVMKDPATGDIVQCKGSSTGISAIADAKAAQDCAAGYQAAGWARMN